jgi:hypothetical protein
MSEFQRQCQWFRDKYIGFQKGMVPSFKMGTCWQLKKHNVKVILWGFFLTKLDFGH